MRLLTSLVTFTLFAFLLTSEVRAAPGDVDPLDLNMVGASVVATAVQPDGKTIIGGSFTSVLGVPRNNLARLNADGTLDMGFDPKPDSYINCVAVQADGKVIICGDFTSLQPNGAATATARNRIARVKIDGALDTAFDPAANDVITCMAVQEDGKFLIGGAFTTIQGANASPVITRNHIARLDANGMLDIGFDPNVSNGNVVSSVYSVAVQTDGKVLFGGFFTKVQPNGAALLTTRNRIARVNADGTLDTGFDPNANAYVANVAVQADGKVLLGGLFTMLQPNGAASPTARGRIARLNADGTLDLSFFSPSVGGSVECISLQADGKTLFGGGFNGAQPSGPTAFVTRKNIARLNTNGTLDSFDPRTDNFVLGVTVQPDGRVLLGGSFNTLQPNGVGAVIPRNFFARVQNDPALQGLSAPDLTQVLWNRRGAAPEVTRVTFDLSTDGGTNWTPLGPGTRIGTTAKWQITGLSLPPTASLRARGVTIGGRSAGSWGLIEQVATYPVSPYVQWKLANLADANAPDAGDDDYDGLRTIIEYTTGGDPLVRNALPTVSIMANRCTLSFPRNTAATDVTFTVQGSDDLVLWTDLARSTGGTAMTALIGGVIVNESGAGALRAVEVRDFYAVGDPAHPKRFVRLQASQ